VLQQGIMGKVEHNINTARVRGSIPCLAQQVEQGINNGRVRSLIPCLAQLAEKGINTDRVMSLIPNSLIPMLTM